MNSAAGMPLPDTSPSATTTRSSAARRTSYRSPPTCRAGSMTAAHLEAGPARRRGQVGGQDAHLDLARDPQIARHRLPDRVGVGLRLQQRPHARLDLEDLERLRQVVVAADLEAARLVRDVVERAEEHDRHLARRVVRAQSAGTPRTRRCPASRCRAGRGRAGSSRRCAGRRHRRARRSACTRRAAPAPARPRSPSRRRRSVRGSRRGPSRLQLRPRAVEESGNLGPRLVELVAIREATRPLERGSHGLGKCRPPSAEMASAEASGSLLPRASWIASRPRRRAAGSSGDAACGRTSTGAAGRSAPIDRKTTAARSSTRRTDRPVGCPHVARPVRAPSRPRAASRPRGCRPRRPARARPAARSVSPAPTAARRSSTVLPCPSAKRMSMRCSVSKPRPSRLRAPATSMPSSAGHSPAPDPPPAWDPAWPESRLRGRVAGRPGALADSGSHRRSVEASTASVDGLGDVVVHAGRQARVEVVLHGVGRHRDDRQVAEGRIGPQHSRRLQAVHLRHLHVHQDGGVAARVGDAPSRPPRGRRRRCPARCRAGRAAQSPPSGSLRCPRPAALGRPRTRVRAATSRCRRAAWHPGALRLDDRVEERRGRDRLGQEDVDADLRAPGLLLLAGVRADHARSAAMRVSGRGRIRAAASRPFMPGSIQSSTTRPKGSPAAVPLCRRPAAPAPPPPSHGDDGDGPAAQQRLEQLAAGLAVLDDEDRRARARSSGGCGVAER